MNIDTYGFEAYGTAVAPTANTTMSNTPNGTDFASSTAFAAYTAASASTSNRNPLYSANGSYCSASITYTPSGSVSNSGTNALGIYWGQGRVAASGKSGSYSLLFLLEVAGYGGAGSAVSSSTFSFPIWTSKPSVGFWLYLGDAAWAAAGDLVQIGGGTGLRLRWLGGTSFQVFQNSTSLGTFTSLSFVGGNWIYVGFDYVAGTSIRFKVGIADSGVLSTTYNTYSTNVTIGFSYAIPGSTSNFHGWHLIDDIIYNDAGLDDGSGTNLGQPYLYGDCRVVYLPAPTLAASSGITFTGASIPASLVSASDGLSVKLSASGYALCTLATVPSSGLLDTVQSVKMYAQGVYNSVPANAHNLNFGTTIGGNTVSYGATTASASATNYCKVFNYPGTLTQFNAGATSNISCPS